MKTISCKNFNNYPTPLYKRSGYIVRRDNIKLIRGTSNDDRVISLKEDHNAIDVDARNRRYNSIFQEFRGKK